VAAPQYTAQYRGESLLARRIPRTLGIRNEDHSNEIAGDFHHRSVYPRDFLRDLRFLLIGYKSIFGDSGVERHSLYPPTEIAHGDNRTGDSYLRQICKSAHSFALQRLRMPVRNEDQLPVHKLFNAEAGEFLSIPGALTASKRQFRKADIGIVNEDHAGFHTACHSLRPFDV